LALENACDMVSSRMAHPMKKEKRKRGNGGLALFFLLLVAIAVTLAYLVFVKNVRIRGVSDFLNEQAGRFRQTDGSATEKKTPSEAFAEVGGLPVAARQTVSLDNTGYAVGYSEDLLDPLWSAYYCGPTVLFTPEPREKIAFTADPRISPDYQVTTKDYKRPSSKPPLYDRGHMAPNYAIATRYGAQAQTETFLMTNIVPQQSTLNQQTWRYLEEKITETYAPDFNGVWVVVGPVFIKSVTHYNKKAAIPDGFFCIILDRVEATGSLRAMALYLRQNVSGNHAPAEFLTTIRSIEEHTGLDFFSQLPDEEETALETTPAGPEWNADQMLVGRQD
jgi:endonuclease G